MKATKILTVIEHYKEKGLSKKHTKADFSTVIFNDECRATLDD